MQPSPVKDRIIKLSEILHEIEVVYSHNAGGLYLDLSNFFTSHHGRHKDQIDKLLNEGELQARNAYADAQALLTLHKNDSDLVQGLSQLYHNHLVTLKKYALELNSFLPPLRLQGTFHEKITADYNVKKAHLLDAIAAVEILIDASDPGGGEGPAEIEAPITYTAPVETPKKAAQDVEALDLILFVQEKIGFNSKESSGAITEWLEGIADYLKRAVRIVNLSEDDIRKSSELSRNKEDLYIHHNEENYPLTAVLEYTADFGRLVFETTEALSAHPLFKEAAKKEHMDLRRDTLNFCKQTAMLFRDPVLDEVMSIKNSLFDLWKRWKNLLSTSSSLRTKGTVENLNFIGEKLMAFQDEVNSRL